MKQFLSHIWHNLLLHRVPTIWKAFNNWFFFLLIERRKERQNDQKQVPYQVILSKNTLYIRPIGRFLLLLSQIVTVLVAAETQPTVLQCWRKTSQWAKIKVSAELCSFKRLKQKNQSFLFLAFSSFTGCLHPFVHGPFSSVWPLLLFSRLWLSSPASPLQGPLWWRRDHLGNSRLLPHLKTHYLITSAKSLWKASRPQVLWMRTSLREHPSLCHSSDDEHWGGAGRRPFLLNGAPLETCVVPYSLGTSAS